jgi:hypothetical protein
MVSAPLISGTSWLRGLDLNQRPLGYERNIGRDALQHDTTSSKEVEYLGEANRRY